MSQVLVFVGIVTAFALVAVLAKPAVSGRPRRRPPRSDGSRRAGGGRGDRTSYDGDIPPGGGPSYGGASRGGDASDGDTSYGGASYGDGD
ncbi:hypothetical protein ABZ686_02195 [Streptomyces sp. NPDC006992]|uniref:hypothetical protein n=1 Tax=Streptomyces sp. NPDC006992 TaxID=3155601 RepID=UPI0033C708B9